MKALTLEKYIRLSGLVTGKEKSVTQNKKTFQFVRFRDQCIYTTSKPLNNLSCWCRPQVDLRPPPCWAITQISNSYTTGHVMSYQISFI